MKKNNVLNSLLILTVFATATPTPAYARRSKRKYTQQAQVEKKDRTPLWGFLGGLGTGSLIGGLAGGGKWAAFGGIIGAGTSLAIGAAIRHAKKRRAEREAQKNNLHTNNDTSNN